MADLPISLEQIFKTMVNEMPYGFAYVKILQNEKGEPTDGILLEINKKFEEFTGLKREKIINQKATTILPGIEKETPNLISLFGKTGLTGEAAEHEFYFDPFKKWYRVYFFSPQKEYVIAIFSDISDTKKSEVLLKGALRALRAISECNQVIIFGESENEIIQKICEKIISVAGYKFAWIGYAQNDVAKSVLPVAQAGFEEGYLKNIHVTWEDNEFGRGPTGKSIRTKQVAIMQNMATNPEYAPWREEALKRGYASSICIPLIINGTIGSLCIYASESDAFDEEEVKLLTELVNNLAFGIKSIRTKELARNINRALRTIRICNQIIVHEKDEESIIKKICEAIVSSGYVMAWVGFAQNNPEKSIKSMGYAGKEDNFLQKSATWADVPLGQRPAGIVIRTGVMYKSQNISVEPFSPEWKEEALKRGYKSVIALPIVFDQIKGSLTIFSGEDNAFNEEEVSLLDELANDLSFGLQSIKDQERISKIGAYNRNLIEISPDPLVTIAPDGKITDVNSATEKITGIERKELIGTNFANYFTDSKKAEEGYQQVFKQGFVKDYPLEIKHKDGLITPVLYNATIYKNDKGVVEGIFAAARDVSDRKKFEEKLEQSRNQLQKILTSISDGFFTLDKDFRYTYINDQAAIMVGKNSAKDLQGKLLFEEFPQAIGTSYDKMYHDAMTNRKIIHFDEYFEPFKKWYQGTVYPYSGGISVFFQDITEQKKMQEELKKISTYNRNLIEISLDPLITIGPDGKITDVNSATETVTGLSREELIGTNFSNYFTDSKKAEEGYQLVFKQGTVRDYPLKIKRKDGTITSVLYNASVYKDDKGVIEGVFAAARDISQLEKIQSALTQTEERYKTYIENSNDVMYAVDVKGIVQYLSPQARKFGLDPETVINKKTFEDLLPEKTRNQVKQEYQKILTTQPQGFITLEYLSPDGRKFWLEASGRILFDKQNKPIGSIGIMRDVTERKLAEDRLKELDTIKSRFIRVVSHQLRTPLAAIRWQLESLLSEHDHLSDLQKQLVKESHRADLEIINTINDLVTALDIEEGREVRLDKSETSFVSLWESVEIEYQEKCKVKNIACSLTKPPTIMPLVYIDTEKIRTVLEKIADNALIYTKDAGQIFVTINQTEENIHFEIKDNGIGIPKDEQPYIFSRFYRASNAANMRPDASGLGLYIAKNFIESHGGKIGFSSEEGKGSTFWFDIPIK